VTRRARESSGFSLVEMLMSAGIMAVVTAGIFTVVNPARGTFQLQPELADMQQRLRVVADALFKDLVAAGAGGSMGSDAAAFEHFFPSVFPMRRGLLSPDPPDVFKSDTITLMSVPATAAQTKTTQAMAGSSSDLPVEAQPACPPADRLCGFAAGMNAVIYDDMGTFDIFTIAGVDSAALTIVRAPGSLSKAYGAGARVTQAASVTYSLNAPASQMMRYNGMHSDAAAADNIVSLIFEYYGEAQPPSLKQPGTDESVTYGPMPPKAGVAAGPFWPPGENCTIQVAGEQQVPRLAVLGGGLSLVRLDPAMLTDGPWCPDSANANRWDADLLRVRKIFVTLRVRSALAALHLPDREIRFEVTPRNLSVER
jgi:Tfp pilus assembly protein PilW